MIEIRIHGRGGQGGVTLAKIIATSRFLKGQSVQAFGLYAAERSGAPIQAFCRFSDETIHNRNVIYRPDHVIVLDPTLIGPAVVDGLKTGGWLLVNTVDSPGALVEQFPRQRIATIDATRIARKNGLGTQSLPIVNTALAGAVARMLGFELSEVHAALEHLNFTGGNLSAASEAFEQLETSAASHPGIEGEDESPAPPTRPRSPSFLEGGGGLFPTVRTGNWATQQPHRQQMVAPCNHVCPAGNDVRGFLQALAREQVDEAAEILFRTTPFPAICGRVCPAPCMDSCNRLGLDGSVNVRELERYVGDRSNLTLEATNGRETSVAVIGSGPAGLTAAYHLARLGYPVTVYEAGEKLGGLLRTGIPGYRLPEKVLDRELSRILGLGVRARTGVSVDRARLLEMTNDYDAVLVATGLQELQELRLGTGNGAVEQGIEFLARAKVDPPRLDGDDVVVVGGGNTAVDAARTALRLGADSVRLVYRRTRFEMPAIQEEIDQALEEGIELLQLLLPVAITGAGEDESGRTDYSLTCRRMELGAPDASGRMRPVEVAGSDFDLGCHRVILALGQSADLSVFPDGTEVHEGEQLLGLIQKPVFAIGDLATGDGTVAGAIGSGRRAALHIHQTLDGEVPEDTTASEARRHVDVWSDQVVRPEAMRLHLFERQAPGAGESLQPWQRTWNFEEVHQGLRDLEEAKRCLSCGGCNECDRCITYCPEGVLKRVGSAFEFDYSFCKGCGVCAAECPRNVIFMSHL